MFTLSLTARKDLFDIVIFFARKPSFFIDRRPFWKLEAEKEVMEIFWKYLGNILEARGWERGVGNISTNWRQTF